jgi:hypothetical protein
MCSVLPDPALRSRCLFQYGHLGISRVWFWQLALDEHRTVEPVVERSLTGVFD